MSTHPEYEPATVSVAEAARRLGVHPNTMRAWSDQGHIRSLRLGPRRDRRFRESDLLVLEAGVATRPSPGQGDPWHERRDAAVARMALDLAAHLDRGQVMARLVDCALRAFSADHAAVLPVTAAGRLMTGPADDAMTSTQRSLASLPDRVVAELLVGGRPGMVLVQRKQAPRAAARGIIDRQAWRALRAAMARDRLAGLAIQPLRDGLAAEGLLLVGHEALPTWGSSDLHDLAVLGWGGATALRNAATYQHMETWAAQLQSIGQLGTRLNRLTTVADIGAAICGELHQLIEYHNARVYQVMGDEVVPIAWRGQIGAYLNEDGDALRLKVGYGITGWVARHGVAQYLPDAARDPRAQTIPGTEDDLDESMLLAPMLFEDRVLGVIVLSKLGLEQFGPDDLRYLGIYASMAAQAMANAEATGQLRAKSEALEQQLEGQRELLSVTESILSDLDPVAVVEKIADRLSGLIPVDDMGIALRDPQTRRLTPLLARGGHAEIFSHRLPEHADLVARVLEHGQARLAQSPTSGAGEEPLLGMGPRGSALTVVPLRSRGHTMGVLTLERHGAEASFSHEEFEIIKLFAGHVSIALQNALDHQAVELRARTDALTGLRHQGTLRRDLALAVTEGARFGLLMIDLDDFKVFNDRHGHEAGNVLLRTLAEAMRSACREADQVYRYGGDEFAIVLPGARTEGALDVATRVREAVATRIYPATGLPAGVRCSVGLATFPDDARDARSLLLAADRACYTAKRAGRDRVVLASESQPPPVDDALAPGSTTGRASRRPNASPDDMRPDRSGRTGPHSAGRRQGRAGDDDVGIPGHAQDLDSRPLVDRKAETPVGVLAE